MFTILNAIFLAIVDAFLRTVPGELTLPILRLMVAGRKNPEKAAYAAEKLAELELRVQRARDGFDYTQEEEESAYADSFLDNGTDDAWEISQSSEIRDPEDDDDLDGLSVEQLEQLLLIATTIFVGGYNVEAALPKAKKAPRGVYLARLQREKELSVWHQTPKMVWWKGKRVTIFPENWEHDRYGEPVVKIIPKTGDAARPRNVANEIIFGERVPASFVENANEDRGVEIDAQTGLPVDSYWELNWDDMQKYRPEDDSTEIATIRGNQKLFVWAEGPYDAAGHWATAAGEGHDLPLAWAAVVAAGGSAASWFRRWDAARRKRCTSDGAKRPVKMPERFPATEAANAARRARGERGLGYAAWRDIQRDIAGRARDASWRLSPAGEAAVKTAASRAPWLCGNVAEILKATERGLRRIDGMVPPTPEPPPPPRHGAFSTPRFDTAPTVGRDARRRASRGTLAPMDVSFSPSGEEFRAALAGKDFSEMLERIALGDALAAALSAPAPRALPPLPYSAPEANVWRDSAGVWRRTSANPAARARAEVLAAWRAHDPAFVIELADAFGARAAVANRSPLIERRPYFGRPLVERALEAPVAPAERPARRKAPRALVPTATGGWSVSRRDWPTEIERPWALARTATGGWVLCRRERSRALRAFPVVGPTTIEHRPSPRVLVPAPAGGWVLCRTERQDTRLGWEVRRDERRAARVARARR